ncbi:MAG TPA: hypothetical protein PKC58_11310 [Ignavibacteria bacterium]|nr:hypothetical protein [Ignavibacteria bacterium]
MKKYYSKFLLSILILVLSVNNIFSQGSGIGNNTFPIEDIQLPKLNGHKFITNSFLPNPFIKSKIKSNLGFATSLQTELPLKRFGDSTNIQINADITYTSGYFAFDYAITDWAAIWLNFSGIARIGTNTASIFVSGITANTNFETGLLFKIKEFKKAQLSSSISINNSNSTQLSIYEYIKNIIDSNRYVVNNSLVTNYNPLTGNIDLRFAYSPSPKWSLLAYVDGGYGEMIDIDTLVNKSSYSFGASFTYDLGVSSSIPFGFGAAFKINSLSPTKQYNAKTTQAYMMQIIYTGSKDFLIGLESNYITIPTQFNNINIHLTSFNLGWTYYFR